MLAQARQKTPSLHDDEDDEREEATDDGASMDDDFEEIVSDSNTEEAVSSLPRRLRPPKRSHQQTTQRACSESDTHSDHVETPELASKRPRKEPRIVLEQRHSRSRLTEEYAAYQKPPLDHDDASADAGNQRRGSPRKQSPAKPDTKRGKTPGHPWMTFRRKLDSDSDSSTAGEPAFKAPPVQGATRSSLRSGHVTDTKTPKDSIEQNSDVSREAKDCEETATGNNRLDQSRDTLSQPGDKASGTDEPTTSISSPPAVPESTQLPSDGASNRNNISVVVLEEEERNQKLKESHQTENKQLAEIKPSTELQPARTTATTSSSQQSPKSAIGSGLAASTSSKGRTGNSKDSGQIEELRRLRHEKWLQEKQTIPESQEDKQMSTHGDGKERAAKPNSLRGSSQTLAIGPSQKDTQPENTDGLRLQPPTREQPTTADNSSAVKHRRTSHHTCSRHKKRERASKQLHHDLEQQATFMAEPALLYRKHLPSQPRIDHFHLLNQALKKPSENFREMYMVGTKSLGLVAAPKPFCEDLDVYISIAMSTITPATDVNTMCDVFNAHHFDLSRRVEASKKRKPPPPAPRGRQQATQPSMPPASMALPKQKLPSDHENRLPRATPVTSSTQQPTPRSSIIQSHSQQNTEASSSSSNKAGNGQNSSGGPAQIVVGNEVCGVLVDGKWCPVREQSKVKQRSRPNSANYGNESHKLREEVQRRLNPELAAKISQNLFVPQVGMEARHQQAPTQLTIPVDPPSYYEAARPPNPPSAPTKAGPLTPEQAKHVTELYARQQMQPPYQGSDRGAMVWTQDPRHGSDGRSASHRSVDQKPGHLLGRSRSPRHRRPDGDGRSDYPVAHAPQYGPGSWQKETVYISDTSSYENSPQPRTMGHSRDEVAGAPPSRRPPATHHPQQQQLRQDSYHHRSNSNEPPGRGHLDQGAGGQGKMSRNSHRSGDTRAHPYQRPGAGESWAREPGPPVPPPPASASIMAPGRNQVIGPTANGRTYELHRAREPFILPNSHSPPKDTQAATANSTVPIKRESNAGHMTSRQHPRDEHHNTSRQSAIVVTPPRDVRPPVSSQPQSQQRPLHQGRAPTSTGPEFTTSAPCVNCGRRAQMTCAACNKVWYCSLECQVSTVIDICTLIVA